jgi:hypothetical protein
MWEQSHLLEALRREFEEVFVVYAYSGPDTSIEGDVD